MFIDRAYAFRFNGHVYGNYLRLDVGEGSLEAFPLEERDDGLGDMKMRLAVATADEMLGEKATGSLILLGAPADTPVALFTRDSRPLLHQAKEVLDA